MDYKEFENLLGKHFSFTKEVFGIDFKSTNYGTKFYTNSEYLNTEFYGIPYNFITITVNKEDIVQSITVHFQEVINRQFYDLFIKKYGEPNSIQVIENKKIESKTLGEGFFQHLTKSSFDLREGTFEEDPLYIIWEKEHFQVKAFLRHKNSISEIIFSKTD